MGAGTQTGVVEEVRTETRLAKPWNVIVHDDPVTLMSYVTMAFQQIFGFPYEKARMLMLEVHNSGRALVWSGAREQAELYVYKLHSKQLLATLELVDE